MYGIPFSVIPFKGKESNSPDSERPKNHVRARPERAGYEIRFPVVENYAFALEKNLIRCDVAAMPRLEIAPNLEPTATFLLPQVGYQEGRPCQHGPFSFVERFAGPDGSILPDDAAGEPPLMPILNPYRPTGTTARVYFLTTRPCRGTTHSHVDQVVLDAERWEAATAFRLEQAAAARRWAEAVNNWGQVGKWRFEVNRDPQRLGEELRQWRA